MAETNGSTKVCTWCKLEQDFSNFASDKNRKDGKHPHCRACNKERTAKRYSENKEEYAAKRKADYEKNKDRYKILAKEWAQNNREKRKEIVKKYVSENPEKRYETQRNSRLANPGMYAAHFKARQQRKRQAMPVWANEENIKAIYRQSAWVTRVTGVKHHVDHYFPLKSDVVCGLHNEFNLRIVPASVNIAKYNHFPE